MICTENRVFCPRCAVCALSSFGTTRGIRTSTGSCTVRIACAAILSLGSVGKPHVSESGPAEQWHRGSGGSIVALRWNDFFLNE
jgi:hypothetical protein